MSNIIIIGGGAAGLMAAGYAIQNGHKVTIIEHNNQLGKKLLITGKGRCNVTNNCDEELFLKNVRTNSRFLYSSIYGFNTQDTISLFEGLGVPLKTERGRRVFPVSDRAQDILNALKNFSSKAKIVYATATGVKTQDDKVVGVCLSDESVLPADKVLIATGGMSYPKTGSTGIGYKIAKQVGHTIIPPTGSLVPLVEKGRDCVKMMGLSLKNVNLTLFENNKSIYANQGEMLFTHFGVSGPLVLSASAHIRDFKKYNYKISIDFKPALSEKQLDERILKDFTLFCNKNVENSLDKLLPQKCIPIVIERWGVNPQIKVNQITKDQRRVLIGIIKGFEIEIEKTYKIDQAVITSGGVCVKQVNPKTMESKVVSGLYFAGEVLDLDAYTGGYNLQIAFSTAYAAAQSF